jgi:hypothetical protein
MKKNGRDKLRPCQLEWVIVEGEGLVKIARLKGIVEKVQFFCRNM